MILLDEPYVSDFLIETIKQNQFPVIATPIAQTMVPDSDINWISETEAIPLIQNHPSIPVYSNSENALHWISSHNPQCDLSHQIQILKDKSAFRLLIQDLFPGFYFKTIAFEEIQLLDPEELPFPIVIKPSIGFFSIGVHIVQNREEWNRVSKELTAQKLSSVFPKTVLNTGQFIIEKYLSGAEYAIDYYHDDAGQVVILNILHHLFSSDIDTSDRVYTTSKAIIEEQHDPIKDFLFTIGKSLDLRNFPAHAEVRINEYGDIQPIEINPLRFGGWCTTPDMMGIALGFNSYQAYLQQLKPNWETIFQGKEDKLYSIVVLDKPDIRDSVIDHFQYEQLLADFENPLLMRKMDIHKHSIFGFLFTETSTDNEQELLDILISDLKKYIVTKLQ